MRYSRLDPDWPRIQIDVDEYRTATDNEVEYCEHCGSAVLEGALQRHLGEERCDECRHLCRECQEWPVSDEGEFCPTCALAEDKLMKALCVALLIEATAAAVVLIGWWLL